MITTHHVRHICMSVDQTINNIFMQCNILLNELGIVVKRVVPVFVILFLLCMLLFTYCSARLLPICAVFCFKSLLRSTLLFCFVPSFLSFSIFAVVLDSFLCVCVCFFHIFLYTSFLVILPVVNMNSHAYILNCCKSISFLILTLTE